VSFFAPLVFGGEEQTQNRRRVGWHEEGQPLEVFQHKGHGSYVRDQVDRLSQDHMTAPQDRQQRQQTLESAATKTTTANDGLQWDDFNDIDEEIGEVASNDGSASIVSSMPSMRQMYEKSQEFLSREDVRKLNSANKDGTSEDVLHARIASLINDCPDSYKNFELEWDDNTLIMPSITEVMHHVRVSEINLTEKA
jgi:hypothetical protein